MRVPSKGFAARKLFQQAKDDGMNVEIHWQDADSSSSKGVEESLMSLETKFFH